MVALLSLGAAALLGWYGYRVTGLGVDLWNALLLCSGSGP
jgi:hypothetical protein